MCMRPYSVSPLSPGEHPSAGSRRVRAYGSDCHPARPPRFQERRSWWERGDVTAMMALQLKNGDAAYYQSAEYCRNYTSAPVSYGGSSHYLNRLPGKETPPPSNTHTPPPHPHDTQRSSFAPAMCGEGGKFSSEKFADVPQRWGRRS